MTRPSPAAGRQPVLPRHRPRPSPLRLWLTLLLAVLMPVRGLVAATMACPGSVEPTTRATMSRPSAATDPAPAATAPDCHRHASAGGMAHPQATAEPAGPSAGGHCAFCASGCHAVPLAQTLPRLDLEPAGPQAFAPPWAPEPRFETEAPDRPPRSRSTP